MRIILITSFLISGKIMLAQLYTPNNSITSTTNPASLNVGVGIAAPLRRLEVNEVGDNLNITNVIRLSQSNTGNPQTGSGAAIEFAIGNFFNPVSAAGSIAVVNTYYNQKFKMVFTTKSAENVLTDQMVIESNGHVGIGTRFPQNRLDVRNHNGAEGQTTDVASFTFGGENHFSSGEGKLVLGSEAFSNGIMKRAEIGFAASGWNGGGALKFYTAPDNTTYAPLMRMVIDNAGNVGIGTSSPGNFRLAVEGKIGACEINVTTASWSDYVFDSSYQLRPLEEVQQYIKQNKHLPEIPSEIEVKTNGQDLGEMNKLLLMKIEELTLYVIDMKKQNEVLTQRVQRLENK